MIYWLSKSDKNNDEGVNTNDSKIDDDPSSENNDSVDDNSTENAILDYRKIREDAIVELTEKDIAEIDKECKIIADRETITKLSGTRS